MDENPVFSQDQTRVHNDTIISIKKSLTLERSEYHSREPSIKMVPKTDPPSGDRQSSISFSQQEEDISTQEEKAQSQPSILKLQLPEFPNQSVVQQQAVRSRGVCQIPKKGNQVMFSLFKNFSHLNRGLEIKTRIFKREKTMKQLKAESKCIEVFQVILVCVDLILLFATTYLACNQTHQFLNSCGNIPMYVHIFVVINLGIALLSKLIPEFQRCVLHQIARKAKVIRLNLMSLSVSLQYSVFILPVTYYKKNREQYCILNTEYVGLTFVQVFPVVCCFLYLFLAFLICIILILYRKSKVSTSKLKRYESILRKSKVIFFYGVQIMILIFGAVLSFIVKFDRNRIKPQDFNIVEALILIYYSLVVLFRVSLRCIRRRRKKLKLKRQATF